jgi:hypothetical protein
MTTKLKLLAAGLMVALALVSVNVKVGTPTASAQSPYCVANPAACTTAFCTTYPQLCNITLNNPYYPCGYVGCVNTVGCAPVPYSPIYGFRPCYNNYTNLYPTGYPLNVYPYTNYNLACNNVYPYGLYGGCNSPYVAGAPARINLAVSPAIVNCGNNGQVTVNATVTDGFGVSVANGSGVSYSSTIGSIGGATTIGGQATSVLTVPAGSPNGVATITVRAGAASSSSTVQVNCAPVVQQTVAVVSRGPNYGGQIVYQPGPQQQTVIIQRPAQQRPQGPSAPPFAPPRTGEAGLLDAADMVQGDADANQALIDASREADYGVLDASQYDTVVSPDDSAANTQLATDLGDQAYGVIDASQVDAVIVPDDSAASTTTVVDVLNNPTDYGNA